MRQIHTSENQRACDVSTLELLQNLGYVRQSIAHRQNTSIFY